MKHFTIIFIIKNQLTHPLLSNLNHIFLDYDYYLESDGKVNGKDIYTYDYLVFDSFDSVKKLDILTEDDNVVVNGNLQTNFENIYCIGQLNNSKKTISEQLDTIIDNIINPF